MRHRNDWRGSILSRLFMIGLVLLACRPVVGQAQTRGSFRIENRKTLAADTIDCQRITLADADDYIPATAPHSSQQRFHGLRRHIVLGAVDPNCHLPDSLLNPQCDREVLLEEVLDHHRPGRAQQVFLR
jgi:hypothetical protein